MSCLIDSQFRVNVRERESTQMAKARLTTHTRHRKLLLIFWKLWIVQYLSHWSLVTYTCLFGLFYQAYPWPVTYYLPIGLETRCLEGILALHGHRASIVHCCSSLHGTLFNRWLFCWKGLCIGIRFSPSHLTHLHNASPNVDWIPCPSWGDEQTWRAAMRSASARCSCYMDSRRNNNGQMSDDDVIVFLPQEMLHKRHCLCKVVRTIMQIGRRRWM